MPIVADVNLTDNTQQIQQELQTKIQAALEAAGNQAVSHAKENIASAGRIGATGDLRNKMNHMVVGQECYVGTDVSYAIYNEVGTGIYLEGGGGRNTPWSYQDEHGDWHTTRGIKPIHFLKNAIQDHVDEYKAIIEEELKK